MAERKLINNREKRHAKYMLYQKCQYNVFRPHAMQVSCLAYILIACRGGTANGVEPVFNRHRYKAGEEEILPPGNYKILVLGVIC